MTPIVFLAFALPFSHSKSPGVRLSVDLAPELAARSAGGRSRARFGSLVSGTCRDTVLGVRAALGNLDRLGTRRQTAFSTFCCFAETELLVWFLVVVVLLMNNAVCRPRRAGVMCSEMREVAVEGRRDA
jgi:hypothetical protein